MKTKTERIQLTFRSCNYSLILSGRGEYRFRGRILPVEAPCVLLQWPGEAMDYGPRAGESWEELYLIYESDQQGKLISSGAFDMAECPVRAMGNSAAVCVAIQNFEAAFPVSDDAGAVDRAAWELLMATFAPAPVLEHDAVVRSIDRVLESHLAEKINFAALAAKLRISESTMRRRWQRVHGEQSYTDYRKSILLKRSCRLLAETDLPVKMVAAQLGFADVFYFIRRFSQLAGMTPTAYRWRYHPYARKIR